MVYGVLQKLYEMELNVVGVFICVCIFYAWLCVYFFIFFPFQCIGLTLLGVSIWLLVDRTFVADLFGNDLYHVSIVMLITVSCMTITFSLIGYIGSLKCNNRLLISVSDSYLFYVFLWIVILILINTDLWFDH